MVVSIKVGKFANEIVNIDNCVVGRALVPVVKENDGARVVKDNRNDNGVTRDWRERDVMGVASKYNKNGRDVLGWWRLKRGHHQFKKKQEDGVPKHQWCSRAQEQRYP